MWISWAKPIPELNLTGASMENANLEKEILRNAVLVNV